MFGILLPFTLALHCAADLCNWTGSGSSGGKDSRTVLQVRLRCTAGSVRGVYPGQALRVVLEPNLASALHTTVCIQPSGSFHGASVYVERAGVLELLGTEELRTPGRVLCLRADGPRRPAIYLQVNPQGDVHPGTVGFRYELLSPNQSQSLKQTSCRPCTDIELLMAICNSDFVIRGFINTVSHDPERQTSVVAVSGARLYWQRSGVFERELGTAATPGSGPSWRGQIHTPLRCHVKPGGGEFLFTGSEHFGEAWLGCAPRYKDFLSLYRAARAARLNSCDFPLN